MSILHFRCVGLLGTGLWIACAAAQNASAIQASENAVLTPAEADQLQQQALDEGEAGKTSDALRDYRRVLAVRPEWKEGRWNLGMLEYGSNQFADAKSTFEKVVEFAPSMGMAWSLLGLSEFETADYDNALIHLQKAQLLGIADDEEIARVSSYHLALLLVRASRFEEAAHLLQQNFGADSASSQAKLALGLATLKIPLLPKELDPSKEALVLAAGEAVLSKTTDRFPELLRTYPETPYLHLAYGAALANAGKNAEALKQFRAETKVSPASPLPWQAISRIETQLGATSEARSAAEHAQKLAAALPGTTSPEQRIVQFYADAAARAGTASELDQALWISALREYTGGEYAKANADLKTWLAGNQQNGTGWALLGLCEYELKDYANALLHLDRGAKLGLNAKPEYLYQARYTYGILLVQAGRFDEATEILATEINAPAPLGAKVEAALGLALLRRAEFPDASPQQAELFQAAGHIAVLLETSRYDEAFPQFKQLLEKYPTLPFLHYAYGTALIALSEFDQAAVQMEAEAALSPGSELPRVRLASIALRQHDAETAIKWARQAVQLTPQSAEAHYLLGRASLESGDVAGAISELETASLLSPSSPEIHFNLAKAYARAKRPEKAEQERETFTRLSEEQKASPAAR